MRHRKAGKRLGRPSAHRKAMMTNLLASLVKHERIVTTLVRAKELSKIADKVITLAKKGTDASMIQLARHLKYERTLVITKLVKEIAPRLQDRQGGYTRVIKLGFRRGDGAETAIVEYVGADANIVPKEIKEEETASE